MRISGLAAASGVPVPTLKYYLRERLLHPGEVTSRTQAQYDDSHVDRVRLIRALTEVGGLSLASVRRVLWAIDDPGVTRLDILATAQAALVEADAAPATDEQRARAREWLDHRGWLAPEGDPLVDALGRAWGAIEAAGVNVDVARMDAYADSVFQAAQVDLSSVPDDPGSGVRQVVLGTVLLDPVLAVLRKIAQREIAVRRLRG